MILKENIFPFIDVLLFESKSNKMHRNIIVHRTRLVSFDIHCPDIIIQEL